MDPLEYLPVRFHFRGDFHHDGREWQYVAEKALKETTLHWKFPGLIRDGVMSSALVMLHDQRSVLEMANHITDAGVMDIYSKMPEVFSEEDHCHWEDEYAQEQQQHSVGVEQQKYSEEQHSEDQQQENVGTKEQQHTANAEEQQEKAGAKEHMEEPEPWKFSNMYYQPGRTSKLPLSRGKSVVVEEEVNNDSDESDSDYVIPPAESNSSASEGEVLELRKYAKEFKEKVRKNMLREDGGRGGHVMCLMILLCQKNVG